MKKTIATYKATKSANIANNKSLMSILDKYEELNLACYVENNTERLVLGNPKNKDLKEHMDHMIENFKNPFEEMYHWCKGEI